MDWPSVFAGFVIGMAVGGVAVMCGYLLGKQ